MDDQIIKDRLQYILDHQRRVEAALSEMRTEVLELRASVAGLRFESAELRRRLIEKDAGPTAQ